MRHIRTPSELYHHGIKGQKWGVRNGPPYPLGSDQKSSSEKKANNQTPGKNVPPTKVERILKNIAYTTIDTLLLNVPTAIRLIKYTRRNRIENKYLDEEAEKLSITTRELKEPYTKEHCEEKVKILYEHSEIKKLKDLSKIPDEENTTERNVKVVNPDYPKPGSTLNCTFCTVAMAMREKGFDVKASKTAHCWYSDVITQTAFKASHEKLNAKNKEEFLSNLAKLGDGAYGDLSVNWDLGGGHSVFFKNENGKTYIYDGQSGDKYDAKRLADNIYIPVTEYCVLNDCKPTNQALAFVERNT